MKRAWRKHYRVSRYLCVGAHVTHDEHMYAYLPLLAQGGTPGILHVLDGLIQDDKAGETHMREKCHLASVLTALPPVTCIHCA
jgi:hypothetical protein